VAISDGAINFSKDGNTWKRSFVTTHEQFVDVVMDGKGNGLALAASGLLFETDSDGGEFRPLPTTAKRVVRLARHNQQVVALTAETSEGMQRNYVLESHQLSERAPARFPLSTPLRRDSWRPDFANIGEGIWLGLREREADDDNGSSWEGSLVPFGQLPEFRQMNAMTGNCAPLAQPFASLAFLAECGVEHRVRLVFAGADASFRQLALADLKAADFGQGYGDMLHRVSEGVFLAALPCNEKGGPLLIDTRSGASAPLAEQPCREYQALSAGAAPPLAVVTSANGLVLCRWANQACRPVAHLPAPVGARATSIAAVGADLVLVVLRTGTTEVVLRSRDGGTTYATPQLPSAMDARVRFTGARGFLLDASGRGFESNDAGETWHRVAAGSETTHRLECVAAGCLTDFGLRIGWALP
jgi:hypothetical protein